MDDGECTKDEGNQKTEDRYLPFETGFVLGFFLVRLGLIGFVWVRFGFATPDISPKLGSFGFELGSFFDPSSGIKSRIYLSKKSLR